MDWIEQSLKQKYIPGVLYRLVSDKTITISKPERHLIIFG